MVTEVGFLGAPQSTPEAQALFDDDLRDFGDVLNASRLWAHQPGTVTGLFELMRQTLSEHRLSIRERGILVAACASTLTDSYCSLAWGSKLAAVSDAEVAAAVLRGDDESLSVAEKTMAGWARKVARDPDNTTPADVQTLQDAGFDDAQIFSITAFVALRLAFSTVNDALGAQPDAELRPAHPALCSTRSPSAAPSRPPSLGSRNRDGSAWSPLRSCWPTCRPTSPPGGPRWPRPLATPRCSGGSPSSVSPGSASSSWATSRDPRSAAAARVSVAHPDSAPGR